MSTESQAPPQAGPAALAEPTKKVGAGWIAALFLANLGVWMGFFTPLQLLLHQQAEAIDLDASVTIFSIVSGVGALAAAVANPITGALSDRTTGRLGRRRPWTLAGAVLGSGGLVLLSYQETVLGLSLCWVGVQLGLNALLAAITAAVPDRVPLSQRATVSGFVGVTTVLGVVGGLELAKLFATYQEGYIAVASAVVLLSLAVTFLTKEEPLPREARPTFSLRQFWVSPRQHPDFAWAFATRFLVQLGNSLGTLYLYVFLRDQVRIDEPRDGEATLVTIYGVGILVTAVIAGWVSDRSGRRKGHVIVSGAVMAVAAVILAVWPTWLGSMIAAAVMGVGYGVYAAVDQALITQVLPAAAGRAKDLGIINIANSLPQVVVPGLAWAMLDHGWGGFPALYGVTAVVTLAGGIFVYRIRSVR